ncbi:MAG TPA: DUF4230 domain-containing protein [Cytophagales bacterium]|nr:DUF4230 domain-containing protein [Cytophagales bacterium]HAA18363.1 DUF4230 domain-containing protein [Cytophagales bacterium]HAP60347.1 DUF4230 domain-containing protein [Cytophagales bacterium]
MLAKKALQLLPWLLVVILGLLFFLFFRQTPDLTPNRNEGQMVIQSTTVLEKVEDLGKLELVKHTFSEIIELKKENISYDTWFGRINAPSTGAEIVLFTAGEAVGCIDLTKLAQEDIEEEGDTLWITLPQPELCYFKVDLENTRIYSYEVGYLEDEKVFIDSAYKTAERKIQEAAIQSNILDQTAENAELMLGPLFSEVSGKKVLFRQRREPLQIEFPD